MYNLTVANDHTYAVGAGQWVVHNTDPLCGDGAQTPWQVHIDEHGNPIGVDTSEFDGGTPTKNGGLRDRTQYWEEYSRKYPDHISSSNAYRINELDLSPHVDTQWTNYFPDHAPYMGEPLIHHHLDYGPIAIPLPEAVHSAQPGWGFWHADDRGPNWDQLWNQWFTDRGL
jgi:hypothetical protein